MKISKLADYSIVILGVMVEQTQEVVNASVVCVESGLPEPTVAKVLKLLSKSDFVRSVRGPRGGYALIKDPCDITLENIISVIDGPISIVACVDGVEPDCSLSGTCCSVRGRWDDVNAAIRETLGLISLADMLSDTQYGKAA